MKTFTQTLGLILLLAMMSTTLNAQLVVTSYMKLTDTRSNYLDLEQQWKKIHEQLIDDNLMEGWELYEVMFSGADGPHFITANHYKDMEQYNRSNDQFAESILKIMKEADLQNLMKTTEATRIQKKNEVNWRVDQVISDKKLDYLVVNFFKVDEINFDAYEEMEKTYYKPFHEASMKKSNRAYWGVYALFPRWDDKYQYVAVDGYSDEGSKEFDQVATWKEVHGSVSMEETWKKMAKLRTPQKVLMLRRIDALWADQD
ncbi:hypothetical protein [Marinoscillum sp. MHG1-6]|uniref:hypothetical protein n=1 Tax=Marinoscillum sp. MHG1-6 TaxID=2959627 RepID=UPI00215752B3|nr:hypothetical protein [Marinoscillum sp. MHG1-6]